MRKEGRLPTKGILADVTVPSGIEAHNLRPALCNQELPFININAFFRCGQNKN